MVNCSMKQNDRDDVVDGPVVSGGGRSPSTLSTGQGAPPVMAGTTLGPLAPGQRWSVARKREVVLRLLRGESAELLSRELGPPIFKLEQWRRKAEADSTATVIGPARRGPKPAVSDEVLLAAIRADLQRSPWTGEGHRKVWARLRAMDGIRVSRRRVLRLMRDNALLSPHRPRTQPGTPHDRQIITEAPNVMWATDD